MKFTLLNLKQEMQDLNSGNRISKFGLRSAFDFSSFELLRILCHMSISDSVW